MHKIELVKFIDVYQTLLESVNQNLLRCLHSLSNEKKKSEVIENKVVIFFSYPSSRAPSYLSTVPFGGGGCPWINLRLRTADKRHFSVI
jgi:hypothetical protein